MFRFSGPSEIAVPSALHSMTALAILPSLGKDQPYVRPLEHLLEVNQTEFSNRYQKLIYLLRAIDIQKLLYVASPVFLVRLVQRRLGKHHLPFALFLPIGTVVSAVTDLNLLFWNQAALR